MTFEEAAQRGVTKLRLPQWNEQAYVEMTIIDGRPGPWLQLYDPPGQQALGQPTPQDVLTCMVQDEGWEAA